MGKKKVFCIIKVSLPPLLHSQKLGLPLDSPRNHIPTMGPGGLDPASPGL